MTDTIKSVSVTPINTVPSDSDDDDQEKHPKRRRRAVQYKVDIA